MTGARTGRSVLVLIGAISVAAVAVWSVVAAVGPETPAAGEVWWPLLILGFAVAEVVTASVEYQGEAHVLTLVEVPFVVGLAYCLPFQVLAARLVSFAAVLVLHRRQPPVKIAFNLAMTALEFGLAVLVYHAIVGAADPVAPIAWVGAYAAMGTTFAVSLACVTAVISLSLRRFEASPWAFGFGAATTAATTALGLMTVFVVWVDWRALWLIAAVLTVLGFGHRILVRLRFRHASLELLYRFTNALSGATDTDEVTRRVLHQARELLRAGVAELVVCVPDGYVVTRLRADGSPWANAHRLDGAPTPYLRLLQAGGSTLVRRSQRGVHETEALALDPAWEDLMAAPFASDGALVGLLVVANRLAGTSTFDEDDLRLLETFASHAAVALRVGELVDRLRSEAEEKEYQALHDALTGLANRSLLAREIEAWRGRPDHDRVLGVALFDLDGFKEVNDALGHHTGDMLLVELARRLEAAFEDEAVVGRFGGDEFALLLPHLDHTDDAQVVAERLRALIESPFVFDDLTLEVGVSIGIAVAPDDGDEAATLFQRADVAMYSAKERRSGIERYSASFDHSSPRRLSLAAELRQALDAGALALHYQPQVDLVTGRVRALEALARWAHPRDGAVAPEEFIPIADRYGLIHPFTRWALRTALEDLSRWRVRWPDLTVSVNVSVRNLLDPTLVTSVADLVSQSQVPPEHLTLELVESSVISDPQRSLAVLARLHDMGVRIAIDDFGTGYSSLAYLKRLPVDEVKIDKSFVLHMASDPEDVQIVRSTIDLARNLGLHVVAEGVQDEETWRLLLGLGCDAAQGHLVSPARPAAEIPALLARLGTTSATTSTPASST